MCPAFTFQANFLGEALCSELCNHSSKYRYKQCLQLNEKIRREADDMNSFQVPTSSGFACRLSELVEMSLCSGYHFVCK